MLALQNKKVDQALFVSPILDMKEFVDDLSTREDVMGCNRMRWRVPAAFAGRIPITANPRQEALPAGGYVAGYYQS